MTDEQAHKEDGADPDLFDQFLQACASGKMRLADGTIVTMEPVIINTTGMSAEEKKVAVDAYYKKLNEKNPPQLIIFDPKDYPETPEEHARIKALIGTPPGYMPPKP